MRKILAGAFLLILAVACSDSTSSDHPAEYGVSPAVQWSGGSVTAHSIAFHGAAVPVVYGGGISLTVTRLDDTTVTIRLPVGPSGNLVLTRDAAGHDTVGVVQLIGVSHSRNVPGMLGYEPLVPEGAPSVVFVAESAGSPSGLSFLDPSTDQVTYVRGLGPSLSSFGIQPSFQQNRFVLRDSVGSLAVYRLFPSVAQIDTSAVHNPVARHVVQLGDSAWLATFSNILQSSSPTGQFFFQGLTNDPIRLVFSADGTRLAMSLASSNLHAPVMNTQTGDTAYTMPIGRPWGVAFDPHADRLYVSASTLQGDSLIAVRGSDGLRLGAVAIPAGYSGYMLAADGKADRLYQVAESSGTMAVLVYEGTSLVQVGQMTCSPGCGNSSSWSAGIGVDTVNNKLHVAFPGSPIPVITYDRLP